MGDGASPWDWSIADAELGVRGSAGAGERHVPSMACGSTDLLPWLCGVAGEATCAGGLPGTSLGIGAGSAEWQLGSRSEGGVGSGGASSCTVLHEVTRAGGCPC